MNHKISTLEALILLLYIGITDLIGIFLLFLALDDFFIIDVLTFPVTQMYFRFKGVRAGYDTIANMAELIPYLGALPLRTVGVATVIWIDRHPEGRIAKAAEKIPHARKPSISKAPAIKTPVGGLRKAA